jgi:1,4-alpha-glucan branching enzyme
MISLLNSVPLFNQSKIEKLWDNEGDKVIAYQRGNLIFVFNFNGVKSFSDYGILANKGTYKIVLNTDESVYGGFDLIDESVKYLTLSEPKDPSGKEWLKLYIPARTALVLKKQ